MKINSLEFKKLKSKWYTKLEKSGFVDAEQDDGNLKVWHSVFFFYHGNPTVFRAKEEYYEMASKFLHIHKFKTKRDKFIWEKHCEGLSLDSIAKLLKSRRIKLGRDGVYYSIMRTTKAMKSKRVKNDEK